MKGRTFLRVAAGAAALTISVGVLLTSQVCAQQAEPDQKALFAAYVNSSVYAGYLEQIFNLREPVVLRAECPTMKWSSTIEQLYWNDRRSCAQERILESIRGAG